MTLKKILIGSFTLIILLATCAFMAYQYTKPYLIKAVWQTNATLASWAQKPNPEVFGKSRLIPASNFALSQINVDEYNDQLSVLKPDINIRAWQRWRQNGTQLEHYNTRYIALHNKHNIAFIGGTTASVIFEEDNFEQLVSKNTHGEIVTHDHLLPGLRRANIAKPLYWEHLISVSKMQIDLGVAGLFFDEVSSSYIGKNHDSNEGFDEFHLTAFNQYLCQRFQPFTNDDINQIFKLKGQNTLDCTQLSQNNSIQNYNDYFSPKNNFDYIQYLKQEGFIDKPLHKKKSLF